MTGAVGDIFKLCFFPGGAGKIKNGILWLTGYLIWSFVDYFCVSIIKLNKTGGFHEDSSRPFPLDKLASSTF